MTAENRGSSEQLLEQAEEMIWNLLDDNLPEGEVKALESMLQEHEQVRELYLDCVQLHSDLAGHFGKTPKLDFPGAPSSPVLGSLGDTMRGIDAGPPVVD
jgi:hypothetical protein